MTDYSNLNALGVKIYSAGTTELISVGDTRSDRVTIRSWDTFYPGGLYGTAEVFIPRRVDRSSLIRHGQRLVIVNGLKVVYEGEIVDIVYSVNRDDQGWLLICHGKWGRLLGRRTLNKPWADQRIDQSVWTWVESASGASLCTFDRYNRLRFTPKNEAWTNGNYAAIQYSAPAGQTVKRVTYNYDFQEGAQAWSIALYRSTDGVSWTLMNNVSGETYTTGTTTVIVSSATGSIDVTLATPSRYLQLRYYSAANQTPASNGTYYAQITNVTVYTETGNINAYEIAGDVIDACSDLSSDKRGLSSALTFSLVPFITNGHETLANILMRAAAYGDASYNPIGAYLEASDQAAVPDGKPVLVIESQPGLTDYDYAIRLDESNLVPPLELVYQSDDVSNYVVVQYTTPTGTEAIITPDDDASLSDLTAFTSRLDEVVRPGSATASSATAYGRRLLAKKKAPGYYMRGPITVAGYIRTKQRALEPVSRLRAGKRLKIEDFPGGDLIFLITATRHTDAGTVSISTGIPSDLSVFLAQKSLIDDRRLL